MILGIIGSPRRNGRTAQLMQAALDGAAAKGAQTRSIYLADYAVRPFTGQGNAEEAETFCPETLSLLCEEAEALIVGAPVYYGDINGLTKDFMDTVRIANSNGKPALGFAIAGGSGKGLLSGVQSIYHWFYHRQFRAIDPTPVSRFNMAEAMASLRQSGARLVEEVGKAQPFPGRMRDDRWADVLAHYATLPYFNADPVDEFFLLARQLIACRQGQAPEEVLRLAQADYDRASAFLQGGQRAEAGRWAVRAYERLYYRG